MSDVIMALSKVLIAAAWADGAIGDDERACLQDLLWRLPEVNARQLDELDIYLDSPVEADERERLVGELQALTATADQRALALDKLDELVSVEGGVSAEERAVVEQVRAALTTADVGLWGSFSRMLIGRRSAAVSAAPNREAYLDDFVRNRVYYRMRQEMAARPGGWGLSDEELRRLALAGGLLALVARTSADVSDDERAVMIDALRAAWSLPAESAAFVVEVALEVGPALDLYRLTREFAEVTTHEERLRFLDALFAVAAAEDRASFDETEQIRTIATGLKLGHAEFIAAKMKLAPEQRR